MNFKPEKKAVNTLKEFAGVSSQQSIPVEITLPDWCSDIKKILKCTFQPGITSVSVAGESVTATGVVDIRLIYVSDKDKIDCFDTQKDLSLTGKINELSSDATVCVKAKTNYVNCRATSQRKVSAEGNIGAVFTAYACQKKEILSSLDGCGLQQKKKEISYEELICIKEKVFDMGETVQIPQEKGNVGKILRSNAYAVLDSQKAVSDKLLIKGQLYTQVLFCAEGDDGKISKFNHAMPISQIIDMPGVDENSGCDIELSVRCLSVQKKSDSSDGSLLEIGAKVAAKVKCTSIQKIDVLDDCYSTSHEIKADYAAEEFLCRVGSVDQQKTVKQTIDIPSGDIVSISDIWCSEVTSSMNGKDDRAKGECSLNICLIYLDSSGTPQYAEKTIDFPFETKLKEKHDNLKCDMTCQVRNIDATIMAKDKIEVKTENGITAQIYSSNTKRILKNIEIISEKDNKDIAALTLYFPSKDEKLWDIARRYSTTVQAIKRENNIDKDTITQEEMILIPAG